MRDDDVTRAINASMLENLHEFWRNFWSESGRIAVWLFLGALIGFAAGRFTR